MRMKTKEKRKWTIPFWAIPIAFFLVEVFAFAFLSARSGNFWPLAFGALWAGILTGITRALPLPAGRIFFGIGYFLSVAYSAVQTGYYILFREMMWVTEFRYASEGSAFFEVLLQYPLFWWLFLIALLV